MPTTAATAGSADPEAPIEPDINNHTTPDTGQSAVPNLTDGLGAVLSDPELLAKLPQVMAMLRPMMEQAAPPSAAPPTDAPAAAALSPVAGKKPTDNRTALLLALKPFLSEDRRNAVDAMLRISALGDVLRRL